MHQLNNEYLTIKVKPKGAELCAITSVKRNTEFMWDANPNVWANYAPNLFPIVGSLKNNSYKFKDKTYNLPRHGFIRYNEDIKLVKEKSNQLTFLLSDNEKTKKDYPFLFNYYVIYTLNNNKLEVTYKVENTDSKTMYFSVGAHPAFKCPVYKNENYNDYSLVFEHPETSETHLLDAESGLVSSNTEPVLTTKNSIRLQNDVFTKDAIILKDLKSRKVTLKSNNHGNILSVSFKDYNYLGLWAKPNAPYVCIEPWLGIADHVNTNQDLTTKEAIIKLDARKTFEASYLIEIDQSHLV